MAKDKSTVLELVQSTASLFSSNASGELEAATASPTSGKQDVQQQHGQLQRKLKARHVQMIAIASNIGTGLFLGSGKALHTGGPLALVTGYVLIAIVLSIMMQCLGEMAVVLPVSGSFTRYATRFFGDDLGFAMGWQYWLAWVSVYIAESSAFTLLIRYWVPSSHLTPLWLTLFILLTLSIHTFPVALFGEIEFLVSCLKVAAVLVFIAVTAAVIAGAGLDGYVHTGVDTWGAQGLHAGLYGGFRGMASVFVLAAFAAGGVEMVGIVAGEAETPRWTLPRAIKTLMFRIALFYVLSMTLLTFVVPYDTPGLIGTPDANSSPFVIAVRRAGIRVLPDVLNAVLLVSVLSVGSASVYISSRCLKAMAEDGFAPGCCARTDRQGRPYVALCVTGLIGAGLSWLNVSSTGAKIFGWFSSISGLAFFIAWLVIIACNWRFHAALKAQKDTALQERFAFTAACWPWLSIFAFVAIVFMVVCQLVVSISPVTGRPSAQNFFANFLGVPIFLGMWAGYRVVKKTRWKKLDEIDLQTGRREEDPEELGKLKYYAGLSRWKKVLSYLHL